MPDFKKITKSAFLGVRDGFFLVKLFIPIKKSFVNYLTHTMNYLFIELGYQGKYHLRENLMVHMGTSDEE